MVEPGRLHLSPPALLTTIIIGAALLAGCTAAGCAGGQGAGGQNGVCNVKDEFALGAQHGGKTGIDTYTWTNTKGAADVAWGGQGTGTVSITITDAAGKVVYDARFGQSQAGTTDTTAAGTTGDWTITVSYSAYSGQVGLTLHARAP